MIATVVGASVGVPYVATQSINPSGTTTVPPAAVSSAPFYGSTTTPIHMPPPVVSSSHVGTAAVPTAVPAAYASMPAVSGPRFTSVDQVFRFDVTREWVYRNWDRKTTAPTDVGLTSIRVPLVMTSPGGLAGALTYFFNAGGQVEHISFRGRTGDSTPLVQFLTRYYQFQLVQSPIGEQIYQVRGDDGIHSDLRTRPDGIMNARTPQQSVVVELEFAKPGSPRLLPPRPSGLQIPPDTTPPAATQAAEAAASSESTSSGIQSAAKSYYDSIHYATPEEKLPLNWKRSPY